MRNFRLLALALVIVFCFGLTSIAVAANETLMQGFYWETPKEPALWTDYVAKAKELADVGITMMWIPPAYKGMGGPNTVGYDVYDIYDLGEFNQCGDIRTKYGTKAQLDAAVNAFQANGIQVMADIVLNHKMGGEVLETPDGWWNYSGKQVWTGFNFSSRNNTYSSFKWHWYHFNGTDYVNGVGNVSATLLPGKQADDVYGGRNWGNDYLMGLDIDYDNTEVRNHLKEWGVWYANTLKLNGFRLDAVKHVSSSFWREWLDYTRAQTGKTLFTVGEAWIEDTNGLKGYLADVQYKMSVFDFALQAWFRNNQNAPDFSQLRYQGLVGSDQAQYAVTFTDNHDTSRVNNPYGDKSISKNKEFLYAYMLTLDKGIPTVWWKDYYAFNMKPVLDPMLKARKDYAYGTGYFGAAGTDYYTYVRQGTTASNGLVLVMSRGAAWTGSVDAKKANTTYTDIMGNNPGVTVTTNASGVGTFKTPAGKISIWVPVGGGETTPPTVSLTAPAAGTVSGTTTVSANATDNVGVTKVEFYAGTTLLGTATTSPYSISWNTTTVTNGTYSLTAKAYDAAGNNATSAAVSVIVDNIGGYARTYNTMNVRGTNNAWATTAMTLVGNYTWQVDTTFGSTTTERFKFDVGSDWAVNFGDTNKDGIAEQGGGDISITGGAGTYRITFNDSTKAYTVVKQGGDTTKPTVSLTAPTAGATLTGNVTVSATASDNVAVAKVEFYAGTTKIGEDTTSPYSISWDTTTVANGTYSITAKAIDTSNNVQTSTAVSVTTNNPVALKKTYATMNVRGTNNAWATTAMTLIADYIWQADATFGSTTTERFKFDVGSDWVTNFGDTNKDGIAEQGGGDISITGGAGTYRITFNDSTKVYTVVKQGGETTPPTVSLTAPAAGTVSGTTTVSANATDNVGVTKVEFYAGTTLLGTATTSPYSISWNTTTVANGTYSLTAKAYDAAGNSATSAAVSVIVSNTTTKIPVTFTINNATTVVGQNIYIAGNIAELGNWAPASAAGPGTCPNYPTWTVTVNIAPGTVIQFKAIKKDASGNVVWEGGNNKTYTVPASGSGSYTWTWTN